MFVDFCSTAKNIEHFVCLFRRHSPFVPTVTTKYGETRICAPQQTASLRFEKDNRLYRRSVWHKNLKLQEAVEETEMGPRLRRGSNWPRTTPMSRQADRPTAQRSWVFLRALWSPESCPRPSGCKGCGFGQIANTHMSWICRVRSRQKGN